MEFPPSVNGCQNLLNLSSGSLFSPNETDKLLIRQGIYTFTKNDNSHQRRIKYKILILESSLT